MAGFRFTLSHEVLGDKVISEPDGWKGAKIIFERHPEFMSLVEYYEGSANGGFIFYGSDGRVDGGIDFIKEIEQTYGFDARIDITVEYTPDDILYQILFEGQLDLSAKNELKDNRMQVPIIRDDFWAKFINRMETPVDLSSLVDLDGNAVDPVTPITVELTCQLINQNFVGFLPVSTYSFGSGITGNGYIQIDFDDSNEFLSESQIAETIDEIDVHISGYPVIDNPDQPYPSFDFDFPGDLVVNNLTIVARDLTDDTANYVDADIKGYLFDGVTEHLLTRTNYFGSNGTTRRTRFVYSGTINDVRSIAVYLKNDSGSTSSPVGLVFDDQVVVAGPVTHF